MEEGDAEGEGPMVVRDGPSDRSLPPDASSTTTTNLLASVKEQELQFERLTRELEEERQIVASQLERCMLGAESPAGDSSSSSEKSFAWRSADASAGGELQGGAMETSGRHMEAEEGLYLPEPDRASLHDSEGSGGHSAQMTSYSDSGYQDSSVSYYSNQNVVRSEPRASLSRSPRAEGQASGQASSRVLRRMASLPSRSQSPGCGTAGTVSPSRISLRTSQGSTYDSPILSEPKPLAAVFPGTTMPPSCTSPTSPTSGTQALGGGGGGGLGGGGGGGRLGSTLSLVEGRGLTGSPLRSGMTAVPQHYGSTLPRQSQPLAYGADPYGLYQRSALPRPDSLIGLHSSYAGHAGQIDPELRAALSPDCHMTPVFDERSFHSPLYHSPTHDPQGTLYRTNTGMGTLPRTTSHCGTLPYQRSSYGLSSAALYVDSYRVSGEPVYSHRHSGLVDRVATRTPSIESIHKDPREFAWRDPELPEVIHMLQHHFPSVQANAAAYLQHLCYGDNRVKVEVCHLGGIQHLVDLLDHKVAEVQKSACGALRNLVYGKATDSNKVALRNCGGVPALLRLLRKTTDNEVRELVTGVLWNLSSCDAVKMTIIRDALTTLTNTVVIPHSGWSSVSHREEHKVKFQSSLLLRNTTGCLRNLSSAGEEARSQLRCCEGLVDSLLHVLKACVNTSDYDSKIVENSVCTLRNLSYRLEVEMPSSRLLSNQELDTLLGFSFPAKELDYLCWGKRRRGRKRGGWPDDKWDDVGPIPGFSQPLRGAELLWHPMVVKPYLNLLAESSNPATLEGAAGSLQNLSAGNWKFSAYIRAAVRKEKGLPILVELLRMDNDRVVCSVATALRNMALDSRNKELIGKYAMRDLVNRLPGGSPSVLSDDTVASVCCTLHEVTSRNMENAKALADSGGIEKLVDISKGRGKGYSMKVVKAAAQVLNTLWQYRELRSLYKQDGWNYTHFITPVSTLERDRYRSQPTLPTSPLQMSPVIQSGGSATSSPAMLGIRGHSSNYQRAQSSMQLDTYYGDNSLHKQQYTGSEKKTPYFIGTYSSQSGEDLRRSQHPEPFYDEPDRKNYNSYRMYLSSPQGYGEEQYEDEPVHLTPSSPDGYASQSLQFKANTNYVDFYSTTRRPSNRANKFTGSPDSWV
ncbi:plakophilin-4-like isoform X1 [Seriola lalandi dorsalis]|uniref:plakophilin-4-like isoform X1 n=1 Tax=Seriola lalandi dorsalis TaxID=1841481 RepID=UPI000C6F7133|nr:plakophilin-4-like isoform X1 [Seriola lalandi dorsalis]XP_023282747.1 plakophilin-4-like isoform X1 [Seriola lalandi dorsalis]XP_023282748.1 plakophilin-4-like isoform X1 [Seriola lalandi dorsalis]